MTLTAKDSPDLNSPGRPGAHSHNSENNPGQSPRSNPVCLEVGITIRSLPTEASALTRPIREEGRTVIVFDNGAVLRASSNMPIGQTVILSNHKGRDVVCRVVGGRNLPSIKGYIEIEFLEPVNDFWGIHQDSETTAVAPPPAISADLQEAPPSQPFVFSQVSNAPETTSNPISTSLGSGLSFEDIPGIFSKPPATVTRETKSEPASPTLEKPAKELSDSNLSEATTPASAPNWRPTVPDPPAEKRANTAIMDAPATSHSAQYRDILSKGLTAYEKPGSTSNTLNARTPLIVGAAALVLAAVGTQVFLKYRPIASSSTENAAVANQPSSQKTQSAVNEPQPAQAPQEGRTATVQTQTPTQTPAQPVAVEQAQPTATVAPVPALARNPVNLDSRTDDSRADQRSSRRQEKNAAVPKQPDHVSSGNPVIQNLKIGSPTAPKRTPSTPGEATAPVTDVASTGPAAASIPSGLLAPPGPTSNPPAPPSFPSPAAATTVSTLKVATDPKLISSPRPAYPPTAKQSNIQGIVALSLTVDEHGKVVSARPLSGPLMLRQAAVEAVKQWKYSPALIDGKPTSSQVTVNLEFRLN